MDERDHPDDPNLRLVLRRSGAARRFSLRVSRLDGRVTLTIPAHASEREAMAFASAQADWIRRAMLRAAPVVQVGLGSLLPYEGRQVQLVAAPVRAARVEGEFLLLPDDPARAAARAEAFLKLAARTRLQGACDHYSRLAGRSYRRITLRDTRSRWGSCAHDGSLMFNWRLIMAPQQVLDYVAAHEVAHLVEMNHSDAFWKVVDRLMPGHAVHRRWVKSKGHQLHGYVF